LEWNRCDNLYFSVPQRTFPEGVIGLIGDQDALVNNLYYPFGQSVQGDPVLSVTVVKDHSLDQQALIKKVEAELREICGIPSPNFLRHYDIRQALPRLSDPAMEQTAALSLAGGNVFLAGDYLLNASLNAAMTSGESAALALADKVSGLDAG
jgi:hypothetical protein